MELDQLRPQAFQTAYCMTEPHIQSLIGSSKTHSLLCESVASPNHHHDHCLRCDSLHKTNWEHSKPVLSSTTPTKILRENSNRTASHVELLKISEHIFYLQLQPASLSASSSTPLLVCWLKSWLCHHHCLHCDHDLLHWRQQHESIIIIIYLLPGRKYKWMQGLEAQFNKIACIAEATVSIHTAQVSTCFAPHVWCHPLGWSLLSRVPSACVCEPCEWEWHQVLFHLDF